MPLAVQISPVVDDTGEESQAFAQIVDDSAWPAHLFSQSLAAPDSRCWAARHPADGRPVGFCLLSVGPFDAEIELIAVAPKFRCQGIGGALLDIAARAMATAGKERLLLEVRASNHPAVSLYEKQGFHWDGRRRHYYPPAAEAYGGTSSEREDAWLFSRVLGESSCVQA